MKIVPLEAVRYDVQTGLVPVVVQDAESNLVLMQAYANREALKRTMATGEAWFWSRSRQTFWHKGATSGNRQKVREIRIDCDGDSVLYVVDALGPACHTGETTCYYRKVEGNSSDGSKSTLDTFICEPSISVVSEPSQSSDACADRSDEEVNPSFDVRFLSELWRVVDTRYRERPQGSYTTYLFEQGIDKAAKKVGEEAVEVAIAAKNAFDKQAHAELAAESADLLFHLFVLWRSAGLHPNEILKVLEDRHGGGESPQGGQ